MIDINKAAIVTKRADISYLEMMQRTNMFEAALTEGVGAKTIIYSQNREGWLYAFFSVWQKGGIAIPVDAGMDAAGLAYIIKDSEPHAVWSSRENLETVRMAMAEAGISLDVHIIDDLEYAPITDEARQKADMQVREHTGICSVEENGHDILPLNHSLSDNDVSVLIYTSGTTGAPKGVMLSYRNMMANMYGVSREVPIYNSERRALILLPLHHVLPLMGCMVMPIMIGAGVAIAASMTGPDIMGILQKSHASIFIGVPRLWQTLYGGIKKKIDEKWITRELFNLCFMVNNRAFSHLVFSKIHKMMGGNMDFVISGGAALEPEIGRGLMALGFDLLEGYGMSETAPIITFTRPGKYMPGSAGQPLPSVECKLLARDGSGRTDVEEGELLAKGPNVMLGYYNKPKETAETVDKDGWIHTGDLARIDSEQHVFITGRCKEIIVLSNGKNVEPSEIEYKLEKFATQVKEAAIAQDGDRLRAIIVPDELWAADRSDRELEQALKREVLEPYNRDAPNYKKVMTVLVYHGALPRTRLDKLQRFKLKDIIANAKTEHLAVAEKIIEPKGEVYQLLKKYIQEEKHVAVHPTDHIETDLAMDSLDKVSLEGYIQQTFGIGINADSMAVFPNIEAMARHIEEHKTRIEETNVDWHEILNASNGSNELNDSNGSEPIRTTQDSISKTSPLMPLWTKLMKGMLCSYNHLTVKGRENLPKTGAYILAPNHQSYMDAPIALAGLSWREVEQIYFYATEQHVNGSLRRWLAGRNNIIIMEQRNLMNSILKMAAVLRSGKRICIFPEGTRTHTGELGDFKKTYAILAQELQVPIIPVRISGAFEAMPRTQSYPLPKKITVEYLPAVKPTSDTTAEDLNQKVKDAIEKN